MADTAKKDIFTPRDEIIEANQRSLIVRDLLGGTPGMVAAGTRYVAQGKYEKPAEYASRLALGYLHEGYAQTVKFLTGQVFNTPIKLKYGDDTEVEGKTVKVEPVEWWADWKDDVTGMGDTLNAYSSRWFASAINQGMGATVIDMPTKPADMERDFTQAEEAELRITPYLISVQQIDILGYRFKYVGGVRVLTYFRYMEAVVSKEGETDAEDEVILQAREIIKVEGGNTRYRIWRMNDKKEASVYDEGEYSIDFVPVVFLELGLKIVEKQPASVPALEALAYMNAAHWKSTVDDRFLMEFVRRPPWFGKSIVDEGTEVRFGPGLLTHSFNEGADLKSVGIDAASVVASKDDITTLEEQMSLYGLQATAPRVGNVTATEQAIDAAQSASDLQVWAGLLKDADDKVLEMVAEWANQPTTPEVIVNTEFNPLSSFSPEIINAAVSAGFVPKQLAYEEFQRRSILTSEATWDEAMVMIDTQAQTSAGSPSGLQGGNFLL